MSVFKAYRIPEKSCRIYYQRACWTGMTPIGFALLLLLTSHGHPGPGPWAALGVGLGLELLLWGSYHLHFHEERLSRMGHFLLAHSEGWFPPLLFFLRNVFIIMVLVMLWLGVVDLGYPANVPMHITVGLLLILLPLKGLANEKAHLRVVERYDFINDLLRYLIIILSVLFVAFSITRIVLPPGKPMTSAPPAFLIIIWVLTIILIMGCLVLFLDQLQRARRKSTRVPPPQPLPPTAW